MTWEVTIRPRTESSAAIDAAAAAWAARVDRAPLSPEEQGALESWIAGDVRRAGAYARACAINAHFDVARALGPEFVPEKHPAAREQMRRRVLMGGSAIAASALVGVGGYELNSVKDRIVTRKGDIRRVALNDGSAVTLNTDSHVRTGFTARRREVALLRGEALFDVAKDPARPFVVTAGGVEVTAVGTSFTVRRRPDGSVGVVVREGVVEVSQDGKAPLRLSADHAANAAPSQPLRAVGLEIGQAERMSAWSEGLLVLNGLTLAEAAAEYDRYTNLRIHIDDPAIARMQITGVFSISDPESFARSAALSLHLRATSTSDGILLSAGA
jgi:transmembrane sensor